MKTEYADCKLRLFFSAIAADGPSIIPTCVHVKQVMHKERHIGLPDKQGSESLKVSYAYPTSPSYQASSVTRFESSRELAFSGIVA